MTWLPAAASFAAAMTLQDCVLLAVAGLLLVRGFYWSMDRAAPLTPFSAALRCLVAGLALLGVALVLCVVGITALVGWWTPSPKLSELTPAFVIAIVALPSLGRLIQGLCAPRQLGIDALALTAFIAVMVLRDSGAGPAACWLLLASSVAITDVAWHLVHTTTNAFLEQANS